MSDMNNEREDMTEEIVEVDNMNKTDVEVEAVGKVSLKDAFMSTIIDVIITGAISIAGLYIFDIILKVTAGYYVKEKISVLAIIYLIVTILYSSIMESSKTANTIGKRASNLKVIKLK
ncbi:hypothetical protein GOM49_10530 [Clostridium bovifaecis]|uniref:RDD domain-containing protein n=1 Tax=Clostridium bovifaecis TaxID=2184719 RepID=A0A6I6F4M0_9CLOT|nr:hypothetical protein GOM49_10530 [Clostridium bovifaecis]